MPKNVYENAKRDILSMIRAHTLHRNKLSRREDRNEYMRTYRAAKRWEKIGNFTGMSFCCPICDDAFFKPTEWIVQEQRALCRACFRKEQDENAIKPRVIDKHCLTNDADVRVKFNPERVIQAREALGLTQREFARECGVSYRTVELMESESYVSLTRVAPCVRALKWEIDIRVIMDYT